MRGVADNDHCHQVCGRSSEAAYIVRDSGVWDHPRRVVFFEVPMVKVAAWKDVAMVPSTNRYLDW
jgi:hypothetical protein